MAYLTMSMFSSALHADTNLCVFLPENRDGSRQALDPDHKSQVLYLLHGMGEDQTCWPRKSVVELVARERDVVVVMPTTGTGFYVDMAHGPAWLEYVAHELPDRIANYFPVSTAREDTFVAGNSMGGYGALRVALERPDRFGGAVSFSGALQPYEECISDEELAKSPGGEPHMRRIREDAFGTRDEYLASDNNLVHLAERLLAEGVDLPRLMLCCGTDDPVTYRHAKAFREKADAMGLPYEYSEAPGGHNFGYWNTIVEAAFDFLGIREGNRLAWT